MIHSSISPGRTLFLGCALLSWTSCSGDESGSAPLREAQRPNVILLVIDTLRADHLGPYGGDPRTSKQLDRLAADGTLFEDCRSPAPWTLPAMASLMTGLYPRSHGATLEGLERHLTAESRPRGLPARIPSLASVFQRAGYATLLFSTNPLLRLGLEEGFETLTFRNTHAGKVVDWGLNALKGRDRERPFFMLLHFIDVHAPHRVGINHGETALEVFQDPALPPLRKVHRDFTYLGKTDVENPERFLDGRRRMYDASIRWTDRQIGRLRTRLDELDVGPTLWIVTSDHGEDFRDHLEEDRGAGHNDPRLQWREPLGHGHGHNLHHTLTHVPLILMGPGVPAGVRVGQRVGLVDIVPTVCELTAVAPPPKTHGRSLVQLMRMEAPEPRAYLAESLAYGREKLAYYSADDWVLILPQSAQEEPQLYDLDVDPKERDNLYRRLPERAAELEEESRAFAQRLERGIGVEMELDAQTLSDLAALGYGGEMIDDE